MFSYAGIALADPDIAPVVGPWIEANIRPAELFPLAYRTWPNSLTDGPILDITPEVPRPVTIGTLFWPYGASRFARAHFVVTSSMLTAIRKETYQETYPRSRSFVFDDGANQLATNLWMLPAWPLAQAIAGAGMWLLTLVDARYWWWKHPYSVAVDPGVTTWEDLYEAIGGMLGGITITVDPIPAAYGLPVAAYASGYRPLPAVLDAIAFSVQQRIVRNLDNTVTAQNNTTAIASVTAQLATGWTRYAGGKLDLIPS